jgi:hypothetical protein
MRRRRQTLSGILCVMNRRSNHCGSNSDETTVSNEVVTSVEFKLADEIYKLLTTALQSDVCLPFHGATR